uniref:XRN2-binding (XTBD) domain-containing protein n=1 Tax=Leptobrachium leishanense TaxID=445787 RepID=A0A8C5PGE4_9ANUR
AQDYCTAAAVTQNALQRSLQAFVEQPLRQYHESDKQWAAREQFLQRHLHLYPGRKLDQLIAMSVVWANIGLPVSIMSIDIAWQDGPKGSYLPTFFCFYPGKLGP